MDEAEDGGSPLSTGLGDAATMSYMPMEDQVGAGIDRPACSPPRWENKLTILVCVRLVQGKDEPHADLMDTRTASTATLHRLDMSPAPSSTPTARRSVSRQRRVHWL